MGAFELAPISGYGAVSSTEPLASLANSIYPKP